MLCSRAAFSIFQFRIMIYSYTKFLKCAGSEKQALVSIIKKSCSGQRVEIKRWLLCFANSLSAHSEFRTLSASMLLRIVYFGLSQSIFCALRFHSAGSAVLMQLIGCVGTQPPQREGLFGGFSVEQFGQFGNRNSPRWREFEFSQCIDLSTIVQKRRISKAFTRKTFHCELTILKIKIRNFEKKLTCAFLKQKASLH